MPTITTASADADALILAALKAVHGPEAIDDLRAGLPALDATAFDVALLALADAGKVLLFADVDPTSVPPARRALLLTEGRAVFSTAMAR